MHIFIDESGIHKPTGQSSVVLVYVVVEDVEGLNQVIIQAEKELRIEPFHWNKQIWPVRRDFLKCLSKENSL